VHDAFSQRQARHFAVCDVLLVFLFLLVSLASMAAQQSAATTDLATMEIEQLMNLKVTTASRFAEKLSDAPGIMSIVTADELRRFGSITLGEVLQRVPGLTRSSQYFVDRSQVAARGDQMKTAGGHILFLINGRPTREVQEGGVISDLLESFPIEILDHIEIIRGPGSVLYGSNAFSAVINLITRKTNNNQAAATALLGADGALATSLNGLYKRKNLSAVAAAKFRKAPDWPVTYVVPLSQRNVSYAPSVPSIQNISVIDRGAGGYFGLNYKALSFMSSLTEWQSTGFVQGTVSQTRLTRDFANLGYDHKASQNWDMGFNVTFTRTTFGAVKFPSVIRDSREIIAEWSNMIRLTKRDRLIAGALFNRIDGVEKFTGVIPYVVTAKGGRPGGSFYAQLDHQLLDTVKLIGGFQTNKIGNLSLATVPRAGVIWNVAPWVNFKALYGQAFRAPSLDENLLDHPGLGGNPNLRPEKVGTFDLGIALQGRHFQAGVDYFHSKQTESITSVGDGISRYHYVNLGEVAFDGIGVEGKYYFRKDFFVQSSIFYQTNKDGNGISNVSPTSNFGFKAGGSYQNRRGLTVSLFDIYDGAIKGLAPSVNPLPGSRHSLNGHLRYELPNSFLPTDKNIAFVMHATNLTGQATWLPSGLNSPDTVPVQQGRVIYAGLEFSLGGD
jgi:outer membrane receptor protein involved in Fe transport